MKETLRETAPGSLAQPIDGTTGISQAGHQTHASTTSQSAVSSGLQPARNIAGDGANHSTSIGGHGSRNPEGTKTVIEKLQSNIQESVKEATNGARTDPNVAEDLGHVPVGKQILEGLGLGGDERKVNLRDVRE